MIGITAPTYDLDGALLLPVDADPGAESGARRVARTATLDGGASVSDGGYTDADRTITASVPGASRAQVATARHFVRNYATVQVSTRGGYFIAVPQRYRYTGGTLTLTLLVTERLDDDTD